VRTFAEDLLRARATQDHDMALGELESRVLAAFGSDVVLDILEFASLEGLLASLASVEVTGPAGEKRAALRGYLGLSEGPSVVIGSVRSFDITTLRGWVETATGASSFIADEDCLNRERVPSERSLVRVSPSSEGTPAALVEVLPPQISLYEGRLIDREELIGLVKNLMFRMVEDATVLGESQISLDGVARFVEQRIKGEGSLASRLGVASLEYLVTPADGLALVRAGDGVGLRLARRVADVERDSASLAPPSPNAEGERMVVETARRLIRSGPIAGTIINSELSRVLGPDLYRGLRGSRKLGQFLRDLGLEVYPDSQGKFGPKIGPKGPGFMVPDPEPSAPIHPPKIQIDLAEPTGAGTNVRPISHAEYKESIARALTGEEFRETVNAQGAEGQISLVTFAALLGRLGPECDYKRAGFPRLKIALQYALTGSAFCLVPAAWNSADFSLTRRTESRGQCLPDLSSEDLAASHGIREFLGKCNPPLRFESQETLTAVCRHLSQGANQPSTLHDLEQRVLEAHPALAPESVKVALQLLTLVGVITGNSEVSLQERAMALNPACYTYESMRERLQSAAEAALEAHRWPTSPGALVELLPISAPAPEFPR
jgi:hypothetical protein